MFSPRVAAHSFSNNSAWRATGASRAAEGGLPPSTGPDGPSSSAGCLKRFYQECSNSAVTACDTELNLQS